MVEEEREHVQPLFEQQGAEESCLWKKWDALVLAFRSAHLKEAVAWADS